MRVVTGDAPLAGWRVLPQVGTALVGVARDAAVGHRVALAQQLLVGRSVDVMAGRALQLAFTHRHVAGTVHLGRLVAVAGGTEFDLGDLLQRALFRHRIVHAVARGAGHAASVVFAAIPQRVLTLVVARGAGGGGLVGRHGLEGQRFDADRVFDVFAAGTVARFTALRGLGRPQVSRAMMRRIRVLFHDCVVARDARVLTDVGGPCRRLCLGRIHRSCEFFRSHRGRLAQRHTGPHAPERHQPYNKSTGYPDFRAQPADMFTH